MSLAVMPLSSSSILAMAEGGDPWDWPVDRVVDALCHATAWWQAEIPGGRLPEPSGLETALRQNEVDGSTLLYNVEDHDVREALGIRSLGQRSAIKIAIKMLRQQSHKYQQHVASPGPAFAGPGSRSQAPSLSLPFAGWTPNFTPSPAIPSPHGPARTDPEFEPDPGVGIQSRATDASAQPKTGRKRALSGPDAVTAAPPRLAEPAVGAAESPPSPRDQPHRSDLGLPAGQSARNDGAVAGDQRRRKKRRLNLEQLQRPAESSTSVVIVDGDARTPSKAPTHVTPPRIVMPPRAAGAFLGPKKLTVDEMFFGDARLGEPTGKALEDEDVEEFHVSHAFAPPEGVSRYIYRHLYHLMANPEKEVLVRNGKSIVAVLPYRTTALKANQVRSALAFEPVDDHTIRVTREDPAMIGVDAAGKYDDSGLHEWDFLNHWAQEESTELPLLGESGSELSYSSSLINEIEAEHVEEAAKKSALTEAEATRIIDGAIEAQGVKWEKARLPRLELRARSVWRQTLKCSRRILIGRAEQEIERLNGRLSKLTQSLLDEVWASQSALIKQCECLEPTVHELRNRVWQISIFNRKEAPPQRVTRPRARRVKDAPTRGRDGGESISCDPTDSEAMSDFLASNDGSSLLDVAQVPSTPREAPSPSLGLLSAAEDGEGNAAGTKDDQRSSEPFHSQEEGVSEEPGATKTPARDEVEVLAGSGAPSAVGAASLPPPTGRPSPHITHTIIDLTLTSDTEDSDPSRTPPGSSAQVADEPALPAYKPEYRGRPEQATRMDILHWDFSLLHERNDRKRIVMKIILTLLEPRDYRTLRAKVHSQKEASFIDEVRRNIESLLQGKFRLLGCPPEDYPIVMICTRLYLCFTWCSNAHWGSELSKLVLKDTLKEIENDQKENKDLKAFYRFISMVLSNYENPLRSRDEQLTPRGKKVGALRAEGDSSSSSDATGRPKRNLPAQKRRRPVKRDTGAKERRATAQKRQYEQELREQELRDLVKDKAPGDRIVINVSNKDKEGFVYVHPHIARLIQKHQIEGVRFIWREVVSAGQTEPQGCLLAHTMGLGKTMQTIAFIVALAETVRSANKKLVAQVPRNLRKMRVLILCPPALVTNWLAELSKWIPPAVKQMFGVIRTLPESPSPDLRLSEIAEWHDERGILIISYDKFKSYVLNNSGRLLEAQHSAVKEHLLQGPTLVVADEAHILRNETSDVSKATKMILTRSRIALTGSPLANNTEEYYSMINWIAPGYLGDKSEFNSVFGTPIQEGLYSDSSAHEYRKALKKLRVLQHEIEPKVHRRDITVLKGVLRSKIEFVITVPLTTLQLKAYNLYREFVTQRQDPKIKTSSVWGWVDMLSLLCCHPSVFLEKLKKPRCEGKDNSTGEKAGLSPGRRALEPVEAGDEIASGPGILQAMDNLFSECGIDPADQSPHHSPKARILLHILRLSLKTKDNVLVFSQRIPTLDYIQTLLESEEELRGCYLRLDGSTKFSDRAKFTKGFNEGGRWKIFLISTRAGGLGVNLPSANRVVIFDFSWNPTHEDQAIGRAYRIGQKKPVFVYRLISGGTFETNVYNRALFKTHLASRVVDQKNPVRQSTKKVRDLITEPECLPQEDLTEFKGKDPAVLDRILAVSSNERGPQIRSIKTSEILQAEADDLLTAEEEKEVQEEIKLEKLRRTDPQAYLARKQVGYKPGESPNPPSGSALPTTIEGTISANEALNPPPGSASLSPSKRAGGASMSNTNLSPRGLLMTVAADLNQRPAEMPSTAPANGTRTPLVVPDRLAASERLPSPREHKRVAEPSSEHRNRPPEPAPLIAISSERPHGPIEVVSLDSPVGHLEESA